MYLARAREIGKACGLETDAECINNIVIHSINLFKYDDIDRELKELEVDCNANDIDYIQVLQDFRKRFDEQIEKSNQCPICNGCSYKCGICSTCGYRLHKTR